MVRTVGKYTTELVQEIFRKENYIMLTKEYNCKEKIEYLCPNNHNGTMILSGFTAGKRCPKCPNKHKAKIEDIKEQFEKENFILISTSYEPLEKLEYICKNGHKCSCLYCDWKRNLYKCIKCAPKEVGKKMRRPYDEFKKKITDINFELLTTEKEYNNTNMIDNKRKVKYKCNNGHINEAVYHDVLNSNCRDCNKRSKGEYIIEQYFINKKIKFITEYKFSDCIDKKPLPYDFYIDNKFLIEYDGNFHFKLCDFFGGKKEFESCQNHDIIKTNYCKTNKISLLRIHYKDYKKIETIINEFINKINNLKNNEYIIEFSRPDDYEYLKN